MLENPSLRSSDWVRMEKAPHKTVSQPSFENGALRHHFTVPISLWNIGNANHLAEIVNPAGVAIDASGQRPEIQRSARIASPGGSMENLSRIARITCELSAFVNPETSALGPSQGLEKSHSSGRAPVETSILIGKATASPTISSFSLIASPAVYRPPPICAILRSPTALFQRMAT